MQDAQEKSVVVSSTVTRSVEVAVRDQIPAQSLQEDRRVQRDLEGQSAIVTGGARGIGRAICLELADHGANILATDLLEKELGETAALVQAKGVKCLAEVANVTEPASIERLVSLAVEKFGKLDIMVNNAGITRDTLVLSMTDEQWDLVLNVNLRAVFLGTRAAAKVMLRQRSGRIINMASFSGLSGNAGQANYAASKAGVIGLTKSIAKEVGKRGVLCNAVAPGFIETDMTAVLPDKIKEMAKQIIPLQRMGKAEEVARVVAFLAGPGANYMTGQVLSVDGGLHM